MLPLPITKAPRRHDPAPPKRRGRWERRGRWDAFFADPVAIESDYHRMARLHVRLGRERRISVRF